MIKLKHLIVESFSKPAPGFKVTTRIVSNDRGINLYDCQVWKDGIVILSSSGTMFELKSKAYEVGIRRSWDIYNKKTEWS